MHLQEEGSILELQGSLSSENARSGEAADHLKPEAWDSKQEQTLSLANTEDLCPRMKCITHRCRA